MTDIELHVEQYLRDHPDFSFPPSGIRHPIILAMGREIKTWLMSHLGGPVPYWTAVFSAAKCLFAPGEDSAEYRLFRTLFEAEGNTFWEGNPDLEALAREYNRWRRGGNLH